MADGLKIVFVVDDDDAAREATAFLLRAEGHRVESYARATEFLDAVADRDGCAVLDMHMPDLDGLEAARQLGLGRGSRLPVILVTGDVDLPERPLGIFDVLPKPLDDERLLASVERALADAR
ncbi:MAG: response regulator [Ectothiorhodospiraceae bacterium]|nr:response regulator [Chromatiales bacterium]MCP5155314.1 response regulator [Ectothiorhodospiraceae bacterium]